jgi:hypothetical protein
MVVMCVRERASASPHPPARGRHRPAALELATCGPRHPGPRLWVGPRCGPPAPASLVRTLGVSVGTPARPGVPGRRGTCTATRLVSRTHSAPRAPPLLLVDDSAQSGRSRRSRHGNPLLPRTESPRRAGVAGCASVRPDARPVVVLRTAHVAPRERPLGGPLREMAAPSGTARGLVPAREQLRPARPHPPRRRLPAPGASASPHRRAESAREEPPPRGNAGRGTRGSKGAGWRSRHRRRRGAFGETVMNVCARRLSPPDPSSETQSATAAAAAVAATPLPPARPGVEKGSRRRVASEAPGARPLDGRGAGGGADHEPRITTTAAPRSRGFVLLAVVAHRHRWLCRKPPRLQLGFTVLRRAGARAAATPEAGREIVVARAGVTYA